jgi:hypothetical protein
MNAAIPATAAAIPDALHDVRRGVHLFARLALASLYAPFAASFLGLPDAVTIILFLSYLPLAPIAFLRCRLWWRLEPGPESLYWHCLGWGELLLFFVLAFSLPPL